MVPSAAARLKQQLVDAKVAVRAAQHDVNKKERKWDRVKKSYLDNDKYSRWDEPSVVARVELRLLRADIGLGKARAVLVQRMGSCTRVRAFLAPPGMRALLRLVDRTRLQSASINLKKVEKLSESNAPQRGAGVRIKEVSANRVHAADAQTRPDSVAD